jgi:hypothetical protein
MENHALAASVTDEVHWRIEPGGLFSRHFRLFQFDTLLAELRMGFWREGCEFVIADHPFAIERKSLWKDGFRLNSDGQTYCDLTRSIWSRQFTLAAVDRIWCLRPAGWFTRTYQLTEHDHVVATVRPAGWFTRKRVAIFSGNVPPPIQVLAVFLVLILAQRDHNRSAG